MRIPRRVITRIAGDILLRKKTATQFEIHEEIEKYYSRELTKYEKARITQVLLQHYPVKRRKVDSKTKKRVIYFTLS